MLTFRSCMFSRTWLKWTQHVTFLTITEKQPGNNQCAQYVLLVIADNTQVNEKEKLYSNYWLLTSVVVLVGTESSLEYLHCVEVGSVTEVSEVYVVFPFRDKMSMLSWCPKYTVCWSNRTIKRGFCWTPNLYNTTFLPWLSDHQPVQYGHSHHTHFTLKMKATCISKTLTTLPTSIQQIPNSRCNIASTIVKHVLDDQNKYRSQNK